MKVILFGATGMVGQGVLRRCLLDPDVESVLAIGRKPSEPVFASAIDFVLEGLYAQRKISRSTEGQFQAAEPSKGRAARSIDSLNERELPLAGNKKKYYN